MLHICTPRKFYKFSRNDREAKRNNEKQNAMTERNPSRTREYVKM
ncbi:hypothetical protein [Helicobacter rodentium]|nr:hypothetical protein [Helicobacter rodentium]